VDSHQPDPGLDPSEPRHGPEEGAQLAFLRALGLGPDAELDPAVRAFRTVLALAHVLRSRMDARLRADGLTTMQAAALTAIVQLSAPTAAELAVSLGTSRQNVAQLTNALRLKGFVQVRDDAADRRRRRLVATERARRYWAARDDGDLGAVRDWFAVLSGAEVATLTDLATRLLATPPS